MWAMTLEKPAGGEAPPGRAPSNDDEIITASQRLALARRLIQEREQQHRANLNGWREPDGYLVPTEPDPDERREIRALLGAAIIECGYALGAIGDAAPPGRAEEWRILEDERDGYLLVDRDGHERAVIWCRSDAEHVLSALNQRDGEAAAEAYGYARGRADQRETLKRARTFIEYARYELEPGKATLGDQFPRQEDADVVLADIAEAIRATAVAPPPEKE
jgi:hypothetical protein